MKSSLDNRRYEDSAEDTEITLGGGSLLAIFFGIVLVCGLVFGFGYSLGRHRAAPATTAGSSVHPAPTSARTAPVADPTAETTPEPAAARPADSSNQNFPADYTAPTPDETPDQRASPRPARSPDADRHVSVANSDEAHAAPAPKPHATIAAVSTTGPASVGPASAALGAPLMVQIAAVSRQEDAQVLAAALRKRGFSPMLRHGLADGFYHVQIGPFSDRAQAETARDRLLGDGYNAILK